MDHYDFGYYQMHQDFHWGYLDSPMLRVERIGDDFWLYTMGWEL